MTPAGGLRDTVAAQLIALSTPGQPLHADSDRRTFLLYAGDVGRQLVQKNIIEMYRARMSPAEGRTAVITAGPPGAGKTTALIAQVADLDTYRDLDADTIKEYLIEQALNDGIYGDLLKLPLADGHPVAPFELAALVHDESTQLIEEIRRQCLLQSENVVVQATLQWDGHGPRIFSQLAAADYKAVRILAVEADPAVAHEQALRRWWERRTAWIAGTHALGGRFVPPAAIDLCYAASGRSVCAQHAEALIDRARRLGEIESVHLTIYKNDGFGPSTTMLDERVDT